MIADHFSRAAAQYAACRPDYPPALFDYLAPLCPTHTLAWDVGTGNGQAALALAERFENVIASDPSSRQLAHAQPHPRVAYVNAAAESPLLASGSVDLICVAQAAHWFDLQRFYAEVRRVAAAEGVIAVWTYMLTSVDEAIDRLATEFCFETVGPYWPPQRRYVDDAYRSLPFPFADLVAPAFTMEQRWTADQFLGYLGTWSSVGRYREQRGTDPIAAIAEPLRNLWGRTNTVRTVTWPVAMRVARPHGERRG